MRAEIDKNAVAARKRWYKRLNWKVHVEKIERHFNEVTVHTRAEGFFENLYVVRDDENSMIQLFAGNHPIGSSEITRDKLGRPSGLRLHTEHGAALVLSQSILGEVAVFLHPYESEKVRRSEPYIIWGVFSDPTQITEAVLRAAVADFFRYMRVSSALFSETSIDRWRIRYLELRAGKYKGGRSLAHVFFSHWFWLFLGAAGSVASIYSLWR